VLKYLTSPFFYSQINDDEEDDDNDDDGDGDDDEEGEGEEDAGEDQPDAKRQRIDEE
jgi:hypothetical protein